MKFAEPKNINYAASVVRIRNINPLPNCDNVVSTTIFGFDAIVGKDTQIGDIGLVFPAETQLSDDYCRWNNLYRHGDLNSDKGKKGYLEDNRRVKAVKFRGNRSSCLFMPLSSLTYLGVPPEEFKEGDTFDVIDGQEICRKYEVLVNGRAKGPAHMEKKLSRVEQLHFPEHYSTENYYRNDRNIGDETDVVVTQKIHGTSIRVANTIVKRKLTIRDRIAKALGVKTLEKEMAMVYGSRKVTKDKNNPNQMHYYGEDLWTLEGAKLDGLIPENFIVFAELIGWTPEGKAIQVDYTYNLDPKTCALYVYRIAHVNGQGLVTDLSWDQVKEFCAARGLKAVAELWRGKHKDFKITDFVEKRYFETHAGAVPLSDPKLVDEGVVVRVDGLIPKFYKAKSPSFFEHETTLLDKQVVDLESQESTPENV